MSISSAKPTSRRMYLSRDELEQYADINITNTSEANDRISQAEEMIDAYVRRADKYIENEITGLATSGTTTTIIDTSGDSHLEKDDDYYKWCEVEIVGGTNEGERRRVASSNKDNQRLTVDSAFSSAIDSTSFFVIYQLGLFPRVKDVIHKNNTYYKRIPENVKRAVAAQVEYVIEQGDAFFEGPTDIKSESLGDYGRQKGAWGNRSLIAPKARTLLRGYRSRTGSLVASNPTKI